MQEKILTKLESSRKELLDLGLRNPLLNYKPSKVRGLSIVQEKATSIYDILVVQGKAMSFAGRPTKDGTSEIEFIELSQPELEENYSDTKLQTNETEINLQNKLLNTYYSAKTSIEEQGVNILYISLGTLHWYESEDSEEVRWAPLILIPVLLERSSARERFRVKYTLEEIGGNISLQAKMKNEFGIDIPDIEDADDEFDIDTYFTKLKEAIEKNKRWKIEGDAIELGFFSFGKFMIYNDLDNAKWPEENSPANHPILQYIFEKGFKDIPPTISEDTFIDKDSKAHELFQVVDADSSQILAILAVNEGRNLVIQGPPGTGKSQTITNIISNAIGNGKKVLFVAEKMAALEVVKRRLDNIHLGEACLELHSHKANKKQLHEELKRVLELGKPSLQHLEKEVSLLENYKEELNAYCDAVNTSIGKSELTTHKIIGYLLQLSELKHNCHFQKVQIDDIENWNSVKMQKAEAFADRIQARLKDIGLPSKLLFWGSKLKAMLPHDQEDLYKHINEAKSTAEEVKKESERISIAMELMEVTDRDSSILLVNATQLASNAPDLKEMNIKSDLWLLNRSDVEELLEAGKRLSFLREKYYNIFIPEAWDQNVLGIRQNLLAYGNKWYKFVIGTYNKSNKQLAALCKTTLSKEIETKLQYVDDLLEAKRLESILVEYESLAKELFGRRWQLLKSDWHVLSISYDYLVNVHQQILNGTCPKEMLNYLSRYESAGLAKNYHEILLKKLTLHEKSIQQLLVKLEFDECIRFPQKKLLNQPYIEQLSLLKDWSERTLEIHHAISWNNFIEVAIEENLDFLTQQATYWENAKDCLKSALQKTWYEYLLEQAIKAYPALRKFERATHEQTVLQFKKLDLLNLQFNRAKVAYKHWENIPKLDSGGQVSILRREFNKKTRHLPIRQLIKEAGMAVQAIKPVFMMSPLSIANFLPPGVLEFDLVIFDEASQVRPVDALGALLRGKQLVVVGDTKQLPPTSFFDSLAKEVIEDEDNVTSDIQSILGLCDAQGATQRMLRWHYRSRHESLIALSNHEFYENKLVIFPSPGSKYRMGLAFHHLKHTIYDRGKTRTNPKEAEIVADAVIEHARKHPKLSLGVVAFSTAQRQAIEDMLELKRRKNPELETFFKSHQHEPFFVKNLENVQGDERDVIYISIGYGRTEEGYVSMSFGPLNNEGGERRLNVLITRAKLRCEIFTNITSDDIDVSRTKSLGIRTLKSFLYFAQHGKLSVTGETGLLEESPFEENVANRLAQCGYIVRKQIGSQGFRIDLAIVDPENPGRYILGIECDGATYHSSRSARDRDRLRQQMLEAIGWRIHRIWSTDWFKNPERELKRVIEAIEKAKEVLLLDDDIYEQEGKEINQSILEREHIESPTDQIPFYEIAVVPSEIASQEIHLHSIGKLSNWIEHIVKIESPVHFDEVARRMVEAARITRVGQRIRELLQQASKSAHNNNKIIIKGAFLWHPEMQKPILRNRSTLPTNSRKIKFIAHEEITLAIEKIVKDSIAIQQEAAAPLIARIFGFNRVTDEMKKEILEVIKSAVSQKVIQKEGDLLK